MTHSTFATMRDSTLLRRAIFMFRNRLSAALLLTLVCQHFAHAQLDRVYPLTGSGVTGTVSDMKKDGVVIKVGNNNQNYRIDQLRKITFEGDPGPLTRGRDLVLEGQYQSALDQLKQVNLQSIQREYVAADAIFYRLYAEAKLALAGQGDKEAAKKNLSTFAAKYQDNYHFYQVAELLGDLASATGDFEGATRFYRALERSSAPLVSARASYLVALSLTRNGKGAEALAGFDKVLSASLDTSEGARLKVLAQAGRSVALANSGQGQEALQAINAIIETLNPEDAELAARVYNARGAAQEVLGDHEAALLDYLHTHLLFSGVVDAHAEALSRMVNLWPKVGQPDQAAAARQELQTKYPGWGG